MSLLDTYDNQKSGVSYIGTRLSPGYEMVQNFDVDETVTLAHRDICLLGRCSLKWPEFVMRQNYVAYLSDHILDSLPLPHVTHLQKNCYFVME